MFTVLNFKADRLSRLIRFAPGLGDNKCCMPLKTCPVHRVRERQAGNHFAKAALAWVLMKHQFVEASLEWRRAEVTAARGQCELRRKKRGLVAHSVLLTRRPVLRRGEPQPVAGFPAPLPIQRWIQRDALRDEPKNSWC